MPPLAPGLFSTITGWPSDFVSLSAMMRPNTSVNPPGRPRHDELDGLALASRRRAAKRGERESAEDEKAKGHVHLGHASSLKRCDALTNEFGHFERGGSTRTP
jgi:hypothetical protein